MISALPPSFFRSSRVSFDSARRRGAVVQAATPVQYKSSSSGSNRHFDAIFTREARRGERVAKAERCMRSFRGIDQEMLTLHRCPVCLPPHSSTTSRGLLSRAPVVTRVNRGSSYPAGTLKRTDHVLATTVLLQYAIRPSGRLAWSGLGIESLPCGSSGAVRYLRSPRRSAHAMWLRDSTRKENCANEDLDSGCSSVSLGRQFGYVGGNTRGRPRRQIYRDAVRSGIPCSLSRRRLIETELSATGTPIFEGNTSRSCLRPRGHTRRRSLTSNDMTRRTMFALDQPDGRHIVFFSSRTGSSSLLAETATGRIVESWSHRPTHHCTSLQFIGSAGSGAGPPRFFSRSQPQSGSRNSRFSGWRRSSRDRSAEFERSSLRPGRPWKFDRFSATVGGDTVCSFMTSRPALPSRQTDLFADLQPALSPNPSTRVCHRPIYTIHYADAGEYDSRCST